MLANLIMSVFTVFFNEYHAHLNNTNLKCSIDTKMRYVRICNYNQFLIRAIIFYTGMECSL